MWPARKYSAGVDAEVIVTLLILVLSMRTVCSEWQLRSSFWLDMKVNFASRGMWQPVVIGRAEQGCHRVGPDCPEMKRPGDIEAVLVSCHAIAEVVDVRQTAKSVQLRRIERQEANVYELGRADILRIPNGKNKTGLVVVLPIHSAAPKQFPSGCGPRPDELDAAVKLIPRQFQKGCHDRLAAVANRAGNLCRQGARRDSNPRCPDPQSGALDHLATRTVFPRPEGSDRVYGSVRTGVKGAGERWRTALGRRIPRGPLATCGPAFQRGRPLRTEPGGGLCQ
jgi:hypothetical protein